MSVSRLPLTGTNPTIDAAISAAQAALDGYLAEAARADLSEASDATAQRRFSRYLSRTSRACAAILNPRPATAAEALGKADAHMIALGLIWGPPRPWRDITAAQAARGVLAQQEGERLLPGLLRLRADLADLAGAAS